MSASAHEPLAASVVSIVIEFDTSANLHASYYSFSLKEQPLPDTTRVTEAAAYIAGEYAAHRMIEPFPRYLGPQGIEEAYAVQQAYLEMLAKTRGPFGGYKIAYTTATMIIVPAMSKFEVDVDMPSTHHGILLPPRK